MQTITENTSLREHASQLIQTIITTISKTISLAALEGRMAGISLMNIIGLIVLSGFLIFATWLTILVATAIWLTSLHINLILALLIISAFNLLLLVPVILLIRYYFYKMSFPATRRQLKATHTKVTGTLS